MIRPCTTLRFIIRRSRILLAILNTSLLNNRNLVAVGMRNMIIFGSIYIVVVVVVVVVVVLVLVVDGVSSRIHFGRRLTW